jgi:hypothetical protein
MRIGSRIDRQLLDESVRYFDLRHAQAENDCKKLVLKILGLLSMLSSKFKCFLKSTLLNETSHSRVCASQPVPIGYASNRFLTSVPEAIGLFKLPIGKCNYRLGV